jgi:hypothetical protein
VPLRAAPVFAATENATVPPPVPLAPEVTVIHSAPEAAVHPHPVPAETLNRPVPPPASNEALDGEIE